MRPSMPLGRFVRSECGSVLVHAAMTLVVATRAEAIAIDYGKLLRERTAAQTAADARAVGGAISAAFEHYHGRRPSGPAARAAQSIGAANRVGLSAGGSRTTPVNFPA